MTAARPVRPATPVYWQHQHYLPLAFAVSRLLLYEPLVAADVGLIGHYLAGWCTPYWAQFKIDVSDIKAAAEAAASAEDIWGVVCRLRRAGVDPL